MTNTTKTRWKFLRTGYKSNSGDHKWAVGKWYVHEGELDLCSAGFHCSKGIYQAFSYVQGETLALVEVEGKHESEDDKEVWEKMRVVKSYKWTKKDSVMFSIYAARLVLDNFEKVFPDDKRPREAIEAAEKYVNNPTTANKKAARSAAGSAESAAWSARSAAESARSAAGSAAWSAAGSAAGSAARSAESAESAARSAAESEICKKLDKWMLNHVKELKPMKSI